MWYDVSMSRSTFDFRIKFDARREVFSLLVQPIHDDKRGASYEAYVLAMSPHMFRVCIPFDEIPNGFCAIGVIGAELPRGVILNELRFMGENVCFIFEFTDEALLEATPVIYRNWIQALLKAGVIWDAFARE